MSAFLKLVDQPVFCCAGILVGAEGWRLPYSLVAGFFLVCGSTSGSSCEPFQGAFGHLIQVVVVGILLFVS